MAGAKRKFPIWARIVVAIVLIAFGLAGAGVGLRYWITSDSGRGFIVSQIDGRRIGPLGAMRVEGLKGDPLTAASLADFALVDDDGVWLRARDARIAWTPELLLHGRLQIASISIRQIEVQRRPHVTTPSKGGKGPDLTIALDDIAISELKLADGVLGPAAAYRISGAVARNRSGSGAARIDLAPVSGPGDRLKAQASWTAEGRLNGEADIFGPPDGAIARLIQAPPATPVTLRARAAGTLAVLTADAQVELANDRVATLHVSRDHDIGALDLQIDAERLPLLEPVYRRTGGPIGISAHANLADSKAVGVQVDAVAPAVTLALGASIDTTSWSMPETIRVAASNADLDRLAGGVSGIVFVDGQLVLKGPRDWRWTGTAKVMDFAAPGVAVGSGTGPLTVAMADQTIAWETRGMDAQKARLTSLERLAPDGYRLSSRGEVNLRAQRVELMQTEIVGRVGDATARGTYDIRNGALELSGRAAFARLGDVAPLTGSASAAWTVKQAGERGPIRVSVQAAGKSVDADNATLAALLGPAPEASTNLVIRNGRFMVESGAIEGAGVSATLTGHVTEDGAVTGQGEARLRHPIPLGGAQLSGLHLSAMVSGDLSAPRIVGDAGDGRLIIAGTEFKKLAGRFDVVLAERRTGQASLTGDVDGHPLAASARLDSDPDDWRFTQVRASLGQITARASELGWIDGGLRADFDADGSLAGMGALTRGTVSAHGAIRSSEGEFTATVAGQASDVRTDTAQLKSIAFDAQIADGKARTTAKLVGMWGAQLDLAVSATAQQTGAAWTGDVSLNGTVDGQPIATPEPLQWRYAANDWSAHGSLSAFGGRLTADVSQAPDLARAEASLEDVDMRPISRLLRLDPIAGAISGKAEYRNTGSPVGSLSLQLADANPVGLAADPVSINVATTLKDGRVAITVKGAGQGFELDANASAPIEPGPGFRLAPTRTAPISGHLTASGRTDGLWMIFGPEDQSLRAAVRTNFDLGGTLAAPQLTGDFGVSHGQYQHAESGLALRDIEAAGVFDDSSLRIVSLTASDGAAGQLTGSGQLSWSKQLDGKLDFKASGLRALNRDDRFAIVSGDGALVIDSDAIRVSGDFRVEQARISIAQPATAAIPTLPGLRRRNFPNQDDDAPTAREAQRPVRLDLGVKADRRVVVYGRGLDTEWSTDFHVTGPVSDPEVQGSATLVRGDLNLAGRRFAFDTGSINLNGPIRTARVDIAATRTADNIEARVRLTGTPTNPQFVLESTPALPQDEILARVLFGRTAAELTALETAQIAAGLAQLAGGEAAFDPAGLLRQATGLDRIAIGSSGGTTTVSAGKYIADNVYLQVGAGGEGGVGAEVEWEPRKNLSVTSSAQANGDTKLSVRWKRDY